MSWIWNRRSQHVCLLGLGRWTLLSLVRHWCVSSFFYSNTMQYFNEMILLQVCRSHWILDTTILRNYSTVPTLWISTSVKLLYSKMCEWNNNNQCQHVQCLFCLWIDRFQWLWLYWEYGTATFSELKRTPCCPMTSTFTDSLLISSKEIWSPMESKFNVILNQ